VIPRMALTDRKNQLRWSPLAPETKPDRPAGANGNGKAKSTIARVLQSTGVWAAFLRGRRLKPTLLNCKDERTNAHTGTFTSARHFVGLAQAGMPVLLGGMRNPQVAEFSTGINA
jgi:hypothetical protein